ncbi:MAG: A/G-specific adenine glycosylase [Eubacterium sp.]|nr:A/G-specific adenine glycosylase [Eubacterium sp.]
MDKKTVKGLLQWYHLHKRNLPWRSDKKPYHIWISEIMLQQTRAAVVTDYYLRFIRELPDEAALSEVPDERLMKLWEGLGYYSRARNLKKAAREIMTRHDGHFPETREEILGLSGIGPYTAGAIGSICFGLPTPAVDGNVLRVMTRFTADPSCIDDAETKKHISDELAKIYEKSIPEERGLLTQSLMELGAVVCGPNRKPLCGECPLQKKCLAHQEGRETDFPKRKAKTPPREEERTVLILMSEESDVRVALHKRGDSGLLAGLWEFPNLSGHTEIRDILKKLDGQGMGQITPVMEHPATHVFSHIKWLNQGIYLKVEKCPGHLSEVGDLIWTEVSALEKDYALPSAFRPFLDMLRKLTEEKK